MHFVVRVLVKLNFLHPLPVLLTLARGKVAYRQSIRIPDDAFLFKEITVAAQRTAYICIVQDTAATPRSTVEVAAHNGALFE